MKKIYINKWVAFLIVAVVGIAATALIMHTVATMNAQYLSYLSIAAS